VVETVWKLSQPPVTGTATVPSTAPVAEPERTRIVPPAPPDEIRALKLVLPDVFTWE
jgi:hypothetical protein